MTDRAVSVLRILLAAVIACGCVYVAIRSVHWPMLVDSPIMHYVNFLMDHGMRPYREITDNNMPGAYLTERWAMEVFGGGDLGWRIYDFFLMGTITAAMTVIAWPYDRLAGVYAGGLFSLMHASEGPWFASEREEVMAALLLTGCAFLFVSVRGRKPALAGVYGLLAALAASIKPTFAPFVLGTLLILGFALQRRRVQGLPYIVWALGGMTVAIVANAAFFVRYGAFRPFLFIVRSVIPAYAGLNRPGWHFLLIHIAPVDVATLAVLAMMAFSLHRRWNWEQWVLLWGAAVGAASYLAQQKGFFHHRYLLLVFLLLLTAMELLAASRRRGVARLIGCAGMLLPLLRTVPQDIGRFRNLPPTGRLVRSMEADLTSLGVDRLQGEVQCFDLVYGCLNSLYHLGLVENTGFTGDLLLFTRQSGAATAYYRDKFSESQAAHPAAVYVITNEVFGEPSSFEKIERWPEFARYLRQNYTLRTERFFPMEDVWGSTPLPLCKARAYRIYMRNGGPRPPAGPL